MNLATRLSLLAAATAMSLPALADDQTITVSTTDTTYFSATGNVLSDGSDTLTFTFLSAGTYDYVLTYTGLFIDSATASVSTADVVSSVDLGTVNYGNVSGTVTVADAGSLSLTLYGTASKNASYTGVLSTVSAVPEPETYAMMLAGLLGVGFMARRRAQQG